MNAIPELVMRELTVGKKTLRQIASILRCSTSTVRRYVDDLIEEGYMTGIRGEGGYYLSRSYELTDRGRKIVNG